MPVSDRHPLLSTALLLPAALMALAALLEQLGRLDLALSPLLSAVGEGLNDCQPLLIAILIATLRLRETFAMQALNGALAFLLLDHTLSILLPQLPYLHLLNALIAGWLSAASYRFLARIKLPPMLHSFQGPATILLGNGLLIALLATPLAKLLPALDAGLLRLASTGLASPEGSLLLTMLYQLLTPTGLYPALAEGLPRLATEQFASGINPEAYLSWLNALNLFALPGMGLALVYLAPGERRRPFKGLLGVLLLANWLGMSPQPLAFALLCFAPRLFMLTALLGGLLTGCALCLNLAFPLLAAPGSPFQFWPEVVNVWLPGSALLLFHAFIGQQLSPVLRLQPRSWNELKAVEPLCPQQSFQTTDLCLHAIYFTKALGGFGNLLSLSSNLTGLIVELEDPRQLVRSRLQQLGVFAIQPVGSGRLLLLVGPIAESLECKIRQLAERQSLDLQPRTPELLPFSFD